MKTRYFPFLCAILTLAWCESAQAVASAELYTSQAYQFGRFEARIKFPQGSGVVSSFFLWKDGSELAGTFWNELDFEVIDADCQLETNAFYGDPGAVHAEAAPLMVDPCSGFHTYTYEWTPDYIAWFVDGVEIRRDIGETATAYSENTSSGMQIRFNIWPGDASFGGVFDPAILPAYQYIDWVEYSSYADGEFQLEFHEDFDAEAVPSGWSLGSWSSPKNLSTHAFQNVGVVDGHAVLALTTDEAAGVSGAMPGAPDAQDDSGSAGEGGCSLAPTGLRSDFCLSLVLGGLALSWARRQRRLLAPRKSPSEVAY